jgi:tetratricopeptide (TPR) repeat protein
MTEVTESTTPQRSGKADEVKSSFRLPAFLDNSITAVCIVVLLTVAVYWRIIGFSFINYDDGSNVFANPYLNPVTPQNMGYLWTHGYYDLYMPVTYTLWGLCCYFSPITQPVFVPGVGNANVNPATFHVLSLIFHTANTALVFLLLNRVVKKTWPACVGALLFALHPVQIESVAWVTGMNNLTSGFFGLLALLLYFAAVDGSARTANQSRLQYALATLFFILALLSKPTAVALPLVAAVLDWSILGHPPKRWIGLILPWVLLSIALIIITSFTSVNSQKLHLALWIRPFIAGDALAYYLSKILLPLNLSIIHSGRTMYLVKASWWGYVTWLFPFVTGLLIWKAGKSARLLQTGAIVFVLSLLPMLGLVVFYAMALSTVATRYLYLAMVGVSLAGTWFAGDERVKSPIRTGVCSLVLILLTVQTVHLLPHWQNSVTVAKAQVEVNPQDPVAQSNYAAFLVQTGKLPESIPHLKAAVKLKPKNAIYQYELGATLEDLGELSGATIALSEAVRLDPFLNEAQINLGGVMLKQGKNKEAIAPLQKAIKNAPNDFSAHYLLGIALTGANRYREAEAEFRHVLSLSSQIPQAHQALGRVLEKQGRRAEAAQVYQQILKATPEDAEATKGLSRTLSKTK